MTTAYPGPAAARICGLPYESLRSWSRSRFLVPSLIQPRGRGSGARYTHADLLVIRVARLLRENGLSLQQLRPLVKRLRAIGRSRETDGGVLVVSPKDVTWAGDANQLRQVLAANTEPVRVIDLEAEARLLRERVDA